MTLALLSYPDHQNHLFLFWTPACILNKRVSSNASSSHPVTLQNNAQSLLCSPARLVSGPSTHFSGASTIWLAICNTPASNAAHPWVTTNFGGGSSTLQPNQHKTLITPRNRHKMLVHLKKFSNQQPIFLTHTFILSLFLYTLMLVMLYSTLVFLCTSILAFHFIFACHCYYALFLPYFI